MPHQNPGKHEVKVVAVDNAGNKTSSALDVIIDSIQSPQISVCPGVFVSGEEILYLEGTSVSGNNVIVFLNKNGLNIKKWEVTADNQGNWAVKDGSLFRSGMYTISTRAKDYRGAVSNSSAECSSKILLSGIVWGVWIISYKVLLIILFIVLILLCLIFAYIYIHTGKKHKRLNRETRDLKEKFYKEYYELKEDIKRQLEIFKRAGMERGLSEEEKELESKLLKDLDDVEQVLSKELGDIEKL